MKTKLYIVIAYRYGSTEDHSYPLGVFNKKHKAIITADEETRQRGGKYGCRVYEVEMGKYYESVFDDPKIVYKTKSVFENEN